MEASLKGRLPLHTQLSKNGITKHITKENMHGGTEEQGEEGMGVQRIRAVSLEVVSIRRYR